MKDTERFTERNSSKLEKCTMYAKRKEQNSSSVSEDQSKKNQSAHRLKREEGYRVTFTTSINSGLLKALERQPIERIHNLQYDLNT